LILGHTAYAALKLTFLLFVLLLYIFDI